jgi:hypothetical protein
VKLGQLQRLKELQLAKQARDAHLHQSMTSRYQTDPIGWIQRRLSEHVWSKQAEIMQSLVDHKKTAVKSCHGVGKSHIASRAVTWWVDTNDVDDLFVVTTAPTFPQVRAILWRYIRQAHRKYNLRGRTNQVEWMIDDELVAFGRKPADHDAAGFQGIHARKVLVVVDEACGINEQLWYAIDSLTTNEGCRILAIGNPDDPTSHFKKICEPGSGWNTIRISAFDSPNLTGEPVPARLAEMLISESWVKEKADEWGVDNPVYISKVDGDFPTQDPTAVIRNQDVVRARLSDLVYNEQQLLPVELGVDVGGGGDLTVVRERRGPQAGRQWTMLSDRPEDLGPWLTNIIQITGATSVKIDSIGIGWGLIGEMRNRANRREHSAAIYGVNVAVRSDQPDKYAKLRDQIWWEAREALGASKWDLGSMDDADATHAELVEPRWGHDQSGRIVIESKDEYRKRNHGKSPDRADALLLAYYLPAYNLVNNFFDKLPSVGVRYGAVPLSAPSGPGGPEGT